MFCKSDLRDGDIIRRRCGSVEICMVSHGMLITEEEGWNDMDDVTDDLRYCSYRGGYTDNEYDIVAVRRPIKKEDCTMDAFRKEAGNLVFSRG